MVATRPFGVRCGQGTASVDTSGEVENWDFSPGLFPCCVVIGAGDPGQIKCSCSFILEPVPVRCKVINCLVGLPRRRRNVGTKS